MAFDNRLPAPTFDLDTWTAHYEGALLPLRLAHVARNCPALAHPALSLALQTANDGKDASLVSRLRETAGRLALADLAAADPEWNVKTEETNKREHARLEGELRGYKNNLIRESIRMGQEDLAIHLLATGGPPPDATAPQAVSGLSAAYAAFGKMRDYCTTPTHMASMTLRLAYTALLQALTAHQNGTPATLHHNALLANAARLRATGVKEEEQTHLVPISHALAGVSQLSAGAYHDAALSLLHINPATYTALPRTHGLHIPSAVATPNDLALYAGLTALATLSRDDLTTKVLNSDFRAFLELEPHLRKAISHFVTAKYAACLDVLTRWAPDWSMDMVLGPHLAELLGRVRRRGLVAYCGGFDEVGVRHLAEVFPPLDLTGGQKGGGDTNGDGDGDADAHGNANGNGNAPAAVSDAATAALEAELLPLITSKTLPMRLDAISNKLIAPRVDARDAAMRDAGKVAKEVERGLLGRLHGVNVRLGGLEVAADGPVGGGGRGGGGGKSFGGRW